MATWNATLAANTLLWQDLVWLNHLANALNQRNAAPEFFRSQVVTISGNPTGGTFTLTFSGVGGGTTIALPYNASLLAVQNAIMSLISSIGSCVVSGQPGLRYNLDFYGFSSGEGPPIMTAASSLTGGSSPAITVRFQWIEPSGGTWIWNLQTGDDVQDSIFWSGVQTSICGPLATFIVGILSSAAQTHTVGSWLNTTTPILPTEGANWWTEPDIRTACGFVNATTNDGSHWRRQKPRTWTDGVAHGPTVDDDGNTLVAGMIAWYNPTGSFVSLQKYSGSAWINSNPLTDSPDLLDSNNSTTGGSFVAAGLMQPGDYIGWHIIEELRAIINKIVWVIDFPTIGANQGIYILESCDVTSATSEAAAEITADAAFVTATPAGGGSGGVNAFAALKGFDGDMGGAVIVANSGTITEPNYLANGLNFSVDFYLFPEVAPWEAGYATYNDQGVSWFIQNQWCYWQTKGPGAGPLVSDPWTLADPPTWPTPLPIVDVWGYGIPGISGGPPNPLGFGFAYGVAAVLKYDVTGGFAESDISP